MGGGMDEWYRPSFTNEPCTMVLIGRSGNGKSATGNSILGKPKFESRISSSGVTKDVECHSSTLVTEEVVNVIDTPVSSTELEELAMADGLFRRSDEFYWRIDRKFDELEQLLRSLATQRGKSIQPCDGPKEKESRTIFVKIHLVEYLISWEILDQVFSNFGNLVIIEVFDEEAPFHSRIRFQNHNSALKAFDSLNGRCIYDDCCRLELFLGSKSTDGSSDRPSDIEIQHPVEDATQVEEFKELESLTFQGVSSEKFMNQAPVCHLGVSLSEEAIGIGLPISDSMSYNLQKVDDAHKVFDKLTEFRDIAELFSCKEISQCVMMPKDGIHVVLLVISLRGRFTEEDVVVVQRLCPKITDYMIVVFTGGDCLEKDESLEDYLGSDCPEALKNILRVCKNRYVIFDNKTKDEIKKTLQLVKLLSLVDEVMEENGGRPYTDNLLDDIKEEVEAQTKSEVVDDEQTKPKEAKTKPAPGVIIQAMQISHDEQLKQMMEMFEYKLEETNEKFQQKLIAEKVARLNAEKIANDVQFESKFKETNAKYVLTCLVCAFFICILCLSFFVEIIISSLS